MGIDLFPSRHTHFRYYMLLAAVSEWFKLIPFPKNLFISFFILPAKEFTYQ